MEEIPRGIMILYYVGGGLGSLLTGFGVLWYVTLYKEKMDKKE